MAKFFEKIVFCVIFVTILIFVSVLEVIINKDFIIGVLCANMCHKLGTSGCFKRIRLHHRFYNGRKKYLNNKVIIVLGMHRSGTSCLTGLLQQAGVELGDVVKKAPHNEKGNRENLDIRALNENVLLHSNGSWNSPPHHLTWNKKHQHERNEIIKRYSDKAVWGFKDPRTLYTLPLWQDGLKNAEVRYIGTFRHPLSVAKSLNARQADLPIEKGVELWQSYNKQLLEYHQSYEFPLICFDLNPEPYMHSVIAAMQSLGVLYPPDGIRLDFFDNALLNQKKLDIGELQLFAQVLKPVMPLYEKLKVNSCS